MNRFENKLSHPIRVLYVDDKPSHGDIVADHLEHESNRITVQTATSPEEGLSVLANNTVDCILSDYDIPNQDGLEFLQAIRDEYSDLPFILYTSKGSEAVASEAISTGVTDYLQKDTGSSHYKILANRITNAVDQYRAKTQHTRNKELLVSTERLAKTGGWELDLETNEARWTEGTYKIYGLDPKLDHELTKQAAIEFYHPDDRGEIKRLVEQCIETGESYETELRLIDADGQLRWVRTNGEAVRENGEIVAIRGAIRDINRLKKSEQNLKAARDRYQMLFENNPIVIWEHDFSESKKYIKKLTEKTDDIPAYLESNPSEVGELFERVRTIGVNQNAVEYYGADSKEHLLNNVDQVLAEEAWELTKELWNSVAEGKRQFRGETVAQTFDGERRSQILDLYVPEAHANDYGRVYMTGTDIDELKQRERELRRERDRLDEFASIASHDIRNPLIIAQGRATMLEEVTAGEYQEHLRPLCDALERMEKIITDTLMLARQGQTVGEMNEISLVDMVEGCWASVETDAATLDIADDITLQGDSDRLRHVFENLFRNAIEHGGDDVTIRVGQTDDGRLYVEDDGEGIPPDKREKVLEAGHTSAAGGTGFGLTIVKRIAEAHGWEVSITESRDGGARFEFDNVSISEN